MKFTRLVLFCLSFLLCSLSHAQNGSNQPGPTATDDNMKMEFVIYAQGFIVVSITNKTTCDLQVRFHWGNQKDSLISFSSKEIRQVFLPFSGGDVDVQTKTVKGCNQQSNGPWLTISMKSLSVRDPLGFKRTKEFVQLTYAAGELYKSADGLTFYSLGRINKYFIDYYPEQKNYYRVKSEDGYLTPIVFVPFERRNYRLYNLSGQYVGITSDVSKYRCSRQYIIAN